MAKPAYPSIRKTEEEAVSLDNSPPGDSDQHDKTRKYRRPRLLRERSGTLMKMTGPVALGERKTIIRYQYGETNRDVLNGGINVV